MIVLAGLALTFGTSALWALGIARWARQRPLRGCDQPRVSVIVAARNEEDTISRCLESLLAQDYPADQFEIVVVDDHSTDATAQTAEKAGTNQPVPLQVLRAPECPDGVGPKKNALAFGIEHSTGEVLMFTDADCRVPRGWIRTLVAHFDDHTGAVTGAVFPAKPARSGESLGWLERLLIHYAAAAAIGWGRPASASGGNLAYRRAAFDQLGGIAHSDVLSGDDDLMVQAIARAGWRVRFASGGDSTVAEERSSSIARRWNAAVRHQSSVAYYPWYWRAAFALSILSSALAILTVVAAVTGLVSLWFVPAVIGVRVLIEGPAAGLLARRLDARLTVVRFLLVEIVLPFYLLLRAVAAMVPRYLWRGRLHQPSAASAVSGA
jgi:GT2 family glycosyltransferase